MGLKKMFKKVGNALKKAAPLLIGLVATGGLGGSVLPGIFGKSGALAAGKGALGGLTRGLQGATGGLFGKGAAAGATGAGATGGTLANLAGGGSQAMGLMSAFNALRPSKSIVDPNMGQPQQQLDPTLLAMMGQAPSANRWRMGA